MEQYPPNQSLPVVGVSDPKMATRPQAAVLFGRKSMMASLLLSSGLGPWRMNGGGLAHVAILSGLAGARPGDRAEASGGLARRPAGLALLPWRLEKVKRWIEAHLAEPLRLGDLAAAAGLSPMHFAAQFRRATGSRPHHYVLARRIDRAKALMARGALPLAEIALATGFQSQAHFSTIFKRATGTTPSSWRRDQGAAAQQPALRLDIPVANDREGETACR